MIPQIIMMCEGYGDGRKDCYDYLYIKSDGGRSESKRPRQNNDCTVRALALALDIPYDEAYDTLKDAGRDCSKRFHIQKWLNKDARFEKLSFPAVKGEKRMNPHTFSKQFKEGVYIVRVAKHVFTFKYGVAYDLGAERPDRCIYTAWKLEEK